MQKNEERSSRDPLTVEQLLQLKRLEKPADDFWAGFERELQQKQLQALVRPSLWVRLRVAVSSTPAHFAPVSTVAIFCVTAGLVAFSFFGRENAAVQATASQEHAPPPAEALVLAEAAEPASTEVEAEEAPPALAPRTDFVVDVIIPEVASTEAASFKSYYVVNALTIGAPQQIGARGGALEF